MTLNNLTLTTELDAVNRLLRDIGEGPVNDLLDLDDDAQAALDYLRDAVRELQTRSWVWNTELVELTADVNGEFLVPVNTIAADTVDIDALIPVSLEQGKLRNLTPFKTGFDTFTKDKLRVEIVLLKPFDSLPEVARQYIYIVASRKFMESSEGVTGVSRFSQVDQDEAWAKLSRHSTKQLDAKFPVRPNRRVPIRRR